MLSPAVLIENLQLPVYIPRLVESAQVHCLKYFHSLTPGINSLGPSSDSQPYIHVVRID